MTECIKVRIYPTYSTGKRGAFTDQCRETETETETQRDRETETERQRQREKDRKTERQR